jgi:hypothetical protein
MTPKELGLCQDNAGEWIAFCGNAAVLALRRELIRTSWEGGHKNLARVREIGEELFVVGGAPLMQTVAHDYGELSREGNLELLSIHWDGIGDWRG